jgi:hypothetical protein
MALLKKNRRRVLGINQKLIRVMAFYKETLPSTVGYFIPTSCRQGLHADKDFIPRNLLGLMRDLLLLIHVVSNRGGFQPFDVTGFYFCEIGVFLRVPFQSYDF